MANAKEIKKRIKSVKDTQKITNAMYLISSTKLQKAKRELDETKPYFNALRGEIKRIFRIDGRVKSRYFYPSDGSHMSDTTYAMLVITADKGLAGSYNQNVINEAVKLYNEHKDTKFFVVGECGRHYFITHHIPIEKSFLYTAQNPTMDRAREISSELLTYYDEKKVSKIFIAYTDMKNGITENATSTRLLPFHRKQFETDAVEKEILEPFEFVPSVSVVLDNLILSYVSGFIYSALIDSFCSEQNARMNAMNTANENAEKLLDDLRLEYNRMRQAAITQEITEIVGGADAL